ncbi:MAG: helix-turn-helix domain-containing protein, partial [Deltaproteobacteria bacterium]|nr:helix-turn-helix domain-containing protein [Deltaproteobacteria bacterium]
MARLAEKPLCSEEEMAMLQSFSQSRTLEYRMVQRAKLVLLSVEGQPDSEIAKTLNMDPNTVATWR